MTPSDNTADDKPGAGITQHIVDSIRDEIIHGQFEVGQRLPLDSELALRFGASQPTVREAMKQLAAQHLIRSKRGPKGGIFVNRPTLEQTNRLLTGVTTWLVTLGVFSLEDIVEARLCLGRACVRLATQRRSDDDVELLQRELRRMSDASLSNQDFCAAERQFHRTIASAAGNKVLQLVMLIIGDSLKTATNMIVFRFHEREAIVEFNTRLLAAIKSRRTAPGEESFCDMIDYLSERYEQASGDIDAGMRAGHLRAVK